MCVNLKSLWHPFWPTKLKNVFTHDFEKLKWFSVLALTEFYSFFKNKYYKHLKMESVTDGEYSKRDGNNFRKLEVLCSILRCLGGFL